MALVFPLGKHHGVPGRESNRKRKKQKLNLVLLVLVMVALALFAIVARLLDHVTKQPKEKSPPGTVVNPWSSIPGTIDSKQVPMIPTNQETIVERAIIGTHLHPEARIATVPGGNNQQNQGGSSELPFVSYPPIDSLVSGRYNVTGDISFLLNFAIVGFPKCGTSTMMEYLDRSPYTKVAQKERCYLGTGRQAKLVRDLYDELPEGRYKRGIKCPRDLENDFAMDKYNKYFPGINYLVGMRHPIRWLESFYNFRVYNKNPMPPVEELVGPCYKGSRHVCTYRARFHKFLANLGKTPLGPLEQRFFQQNGRELRPTPVRGKIFLYHVEQLRVDEPAERQLSLRRDLSSFLDLPELLPPISIWTKPGKNLTQEEREDADRRRLDICHDNHTYVRRFLMEQAAVTAEWILQFFLKSKDVFISSPDHFRDLLKTWEVDPCTNSTLTTLTQMSNLRATG